MFTLPNRKRPVMGLFLSPLEGAYQQRFWRGFDGFCRETDCDLVVFSARVIFRGDGGGRIHDRLYRLADRTRIDGLCVDSSAFSDEAHFARFMEESENLANLPVVLSSLHGSGRDSVFPDNAAGILAALAHLESVHGVTRIAFAGGPAGVEDADARRDAWRRFMGERGLPREASLEFEGYFDSASGRAAVARFADAPGGMPQAIVFGNDEMAIGGLAELKRRGIRVPDDILVTGFDDIALAALQNPPISTVCQPIEEKARIAAQRLLDRINGYPPAGSRTVPVAFIPRASCGCASPPPEAPQLLRTYRAILGMKQIAEGMGSVLSNVDLCREFAALFPSIGTGPAFACLYDGDSPYSFVVAAADGTGGSLIEPSHPRRFLSSQLVPAYLLGNESRMTLVVQALYREDSDFGFLACVDGGTESDVFVALRFQTSAAIRNIMLVSETGESERRYRELADFLPAFIMETGSDGTIRYLNKAARELLGLDPEAIIESLNASDFILEESAGNSESAYVRLRIRSQNRVETSLLAQKRESSGADGTTRWHGLDFKPILASMMMPDRSAMDRYNLTPREREILVLELEGFIGKEIADRLSISLSTVKGHVGSLYRKIGVSSREQLFALMGERIIGTWGYESLVFSLLSGVIRE